MATAFDLNALRAQQEALITRARDFVDKAVESGKTYVETARTRVESESEEFISRVKDFSGKGQGALQAQVSKQLDTISDLQGTLVARTNDLIDEYGAEIGKRIPAAASAIEMLDSFVKEADERVKGLIQNVTDTVSSTFPIEGYDELNVAQVKKALKGLDDTELAAVKAYEAANKARKSVIKAIDELS